MTEKINKEKLTKAIELFGDDTVSLVITLVSVSDPDGVWSLMSDYGNFDAVQCVEFLYFEMD